MPFILNQTVQAMQLQKFVTLNSILLDQFQILLSKGKISDLSQKCQKNGLQKISLQQFYSCVDQWDIAQMNFKQNCMKHKIAKSIAHIKFNNLKTLNFMYTRLSNIQFLSFMYMPNLQILNLSNTYIRSLKPLVKTNALNLKFLLFDQCSKIPLTQFENFSKLNIGYVNTEKSLNQQPTLDVFEQIGFYCLRYHFFIDDFYRFMKDQDTINNFYIYAALVKLKTYKVKKMFYQYDIKSKEVSSKLKNCIFERFLIKF